MLSFHDSTEHLEWFCHDEHVLRDWIARENRQLIRVECDGCLCVYSATGPTRSSKSEVPRLAEAVQWRVDAVALDPDSDIDLTHLRERLLHFGVVPIALRHASAQDRTAATFTTRSQVPSGPRALYPAGVRIFNKQPFVSTEVDIAVPSEMHRVALQSLLLKAGIVPERLNASALSTNSSSVRRVLISTRNDVTDEVLAELSSLAQEPVHVAFVDPSPLAGNIWPLGYTARTGANMTLV